MGFGFDRLLRLTGYSDWHESISCSNGVRMLLDTDEPQQRQIYWTGIYDRVSIDTLARWLPNNGVLVDVGAGVGSICLFVVKACAGLGKSVSAHAFEPMGLNHDRLIQNIVLNHLSERVFGHRLALGAARSNLDICYSGGAGAAAVLRSRPEIATIAGKRLECVPCERLDDWVHERDLTRLDAIKVDIEGAEPLMFRGASETINRFRPVILGEFNHWWAERHGLSIADDCFEPLWNMGYRAFRLSPHRGPWRAVSGRPGPGPAMEDTLWVPPGRFPCE